MKSCKQKHIATHYFKTNNINTKGTKPTISKEMEKA